MTRIIFYGTPELCVPILDKLESSGLSPIAIVTNPDRPVGRKHILTAPPTKQWALARQIPVLQPEKLDDAAFEAITRYAPDLHVVVAYGMIIPKRFIDLPRYGTINVHYSLLPRWRGASPVESAILAGDTESGICIQQMRFKLDSGPILSQKRIPLEGTEHADTLKYSFSEIAAPLVVSTIHDIVTGTATPVEQNEDDATFCRKITKDQGELLDTDTDLQRWQKYRAYHGWPGVFYIDSVGKRTKILAAHYVDGRFTPTRIVREGESPREV